MTANPGVLAPDGWLTPWVPGLTPRYYPLVFDSFWLQASIHGLEPLWFHAVQRGIAWMLAGALVGDSDASSCSGRTLPAALLFGLHPVQVESDDLDH
ncbi:MAG: hypothetical protein U0636_00820 [Phycisphaerales bacterium]